MNVLLPQPDGPMTAVIRFLWMSSETSLKADVGPYRTERSSMSKTTSLVDAGCSSSPERATSTECIAVFIVPSFAFGLIVERVEIV